MCVLGIVPHRQGMFTTARDMEVDADARVRDIKVRRFAQMPANRKNPGVHHTARQSRDREGALADYVAGMRSRPRGPPVAARVGASRPSPFMSRTPVHRRLFEYHQP